MEKKDGRKFRTTKRRKRRGFFGKRPQDLPREMADTSGNGASSSGGFAAVTDNLVASSGKECESISAKKLLNTSFTKLESEKGILTRRKAKEVGMSKCDVEMATGFKLQDASLLSECISSAAVCSSCRQAKSKLQLFQKNREREGLGESLFLKCSICKVETPLATSKRLGGKGGGSQEVNRRSVLAAHHIGHAGLAQFCGGMNLPPPVTKKAYNEHLIQIEQTAGSHAEQVMQDAAQRLREKILFEQPDNIENGDGETDIAHVAVTVDGTWQKRGHSSKIGVFFVISVDTGEILDYEVKSLFYHECKAHSAEDKESEKYKQWKEGHKQKCQINHQGSSEETEAVAAVEIFGRSVETRRLRYTTFVGDGDSSSFGRVKEALATNYEVRKEECVGHVQKRLGTALRKYKNDHKGKKLSDGKSVGGKGRLTDKTIDKMQNYYGKAIRENKGNLQGMKRSIKAIQHHIIRDDSKPLQEQHHYCPRSGHTWCKYWKGINEETSTYSEDNRLPPVFMEELEPTFTRLSNHDLLLRCLKGMTQNQNESANGMLWSKCPKTKFCGARRVRIAACETVAVFNTGAASKAMFMVLCGVTPGENSMRALRLQDRVRLQTAAKKVTEKYKNQRRKLRAMRKSKGDKESYQPGGFSLSSQPDLQEKKKKKNP